MKTLRSFRVDSVSAISCAQPQGRWNTSDRETIQQSSTSFFLMEILWDNNSGHSKSGEDSGGGDCTRVLPRIANSPQTPKTVTFGSLAKTHDTRIDQNRPCHISTAPKELSNWLPIQSLWREATIQAPTNNSHGILPKRVGAACRGALENSPWLPQLQLLEGCEPIHRLWSFRVFEESLPGIAWGKQSVATNYPFIDRDTVQPAI